MESLLERNSSGTQIEVLYEKDKPFVLTVEENGVKLEAVIPDDKVLEAFYHPWLYVQKGE